METCESISGSADGDNARIPQLTFAEVNTATNWKEKLSANIGTNVSHCVECHLDREDLEDKMMFMCLHSWRYQFDGTKIFEAKWPKWATDDCFRTKMLEERYKNYQETNIHL